MLQVRSDYSQSKFEMLKFCYVGDYIRVANSDLGGNSLKIKKGIVFFIKPPLKSSPNDKTYFH